MVEKQCYITFSEMTERLTIQGQLLLGKLTQGLQNFQNLLWRITANSLTNLKSVRITSWHHNNANDITFRTYFTFGFLFDFGCPIHFYSVRRLNTADKFCFFLNELVSNSLNFFIHHHVVYEWSCYHLKFLAFYKFSA